MKRLIILSLLFLPIFSYSQSCDSMKVVYSFGIANSPEFLDGKPIMDSFFKANINCDYFEDDNLMGIAIFMTSIDKHGNFSVVEILESSLGEATEECLNALELFGETYEWLPGEKDGEEIEVIGLFTFFFNTEKIESKSEPKEFYGSDELTVESEPLVGEDEYMKACFKTVKKKELESFIKGHRPDDIIIFRLKIAAQGVLLEHELIENQISEKFQYAVENFLNLSTIKWKPAEIDGERVYSYYEFEISIKDIIDYLN